ncbi:MAG TPA: tetratricopeptide repeat protein, partial [Isosphaeraceae bacterium]|nr:tetratricopeptide repeat protein [Isosphaeraceae bacterium]
MRRTLLWLALSLLGLTPVPAAAQTAGLELRGVVFSVEDGQADRKYLPNVLVTVIEFGASGRTNDQGGFRVRLPAGVLPGQDLTLQEDQKDYYILLPVLSKLRVPATPTQVVDVSMAPKGSKVLLGANFIEQFIAHTADDSAKKPKDPKGGAPDLSSYVNELARQSGRPAEEILGEIGRWAAEAKESDDPRKLGLAAFAEKKFRLAAENFGRAADAEKRRGAEGFRKSAADRTLEGDSYSNALDFAKALRTYQAALDDLKVYRKGRDDLGLPAYPEYASDVRDLALKSANARKGLGERVAGPDSRRHLEEAVREYLGLIAQVPRSSDPQDWATTQNNLGSALWDLGERQGGAEGLRRLNEAVEAYRQALTVRKRDDLPQDWAMTQDNLGNALQIQVRLGGFPAGLEQVDRLGQAEGLRDDPVAQASLRTLAIVCHVATRDDLPQLWATTQNHLGNALTDLGERQGGSEGQRRLSEAVEADRLALTVYTRDDLPQLWATTQNNLGSALTALGQRLGGPEGLRRLNEAVEAYR